MKKIYYIVFIFGTTLLFIGIIMSLVEEKCYNLPPKDFFKSKICSWLIDKIKDSDKE